MKKIILSILVLSIVKISFAQKIETLNINHNDAPDFFMKNEFKYPEFERAHVYLKNGDSALGSFNFDYFDQAMRYINENRDTVVLANSKDVNYITINTDTFFVNNDNYYEWVASSSLSRLVVKRTYKLLERENVGPYGIASPTRNVHTIGGITSGRTFELPPDEVLVFLKETTYYLSSITGKKNNFVVANKNNFNSFFFKKDIDDYIKTNKLNLNKEEDVVDLFIYANTTKVKK